MARLASAVRANPEGVPLLWQSCLCFGDPGKRGIPRPNQGTDSMEFRMPSAQRPLFSSHFVTPSNVIALRPPLRMSARDAGTTVQGRAKAPRPLRLIVHSNADGSCQLVASGRLADVCAELNRLSLVQQ